MAPYNSETTVPEVFLSLIFGGLVPIGLLFVLFGRFKSQQTVPAARPTPTSD
jgi:hypothetical protein